MSEAGNSGLPVNQIRELYLLAGLSDEKIALKFGVTRRAIGYWRKKLGIRARPLGSWSVGKKRPEHSKRMRELYSNPQNHPMYGKHPTGITLQKMADSHKWQVFSEARNRKISEKLKGDKHPLWKGGITPEHERLRKSRLYKSWRQSIFERDNYTCQICGSRSRVGQSVYLEADHIYSFSKYPQIRFETTNGRTLCRPCHRKTHNFGVKIWQR